ncbi:MAG: UvrD-helicase domain-containing protein [Thermomicrobiales bacterium]
MPGVEGIGLITRVDRIWLLGNCKKELDKRRRETGLLDHLDECVQRLFSNPRSPGLNLETLTRAGKYTVLSARLTQACRLILVALSKTELGLLHFDSNHDEAYNWVTRNLARIPTMLAQVEEVRRGVPVSAYAGTLPAVQRDEDAPLALRAAEQFRAMLDQGVERYLACLDPEQQWLVNLNVRGLLLVKGGAGTGKTAVAVHRLLALARQPALPGAGAERVLYLCYNRLLARTVTQMIQTLCGGVPPNVEVATFHTWCYEFLLHTGVPIPNHGDDRRCQQQVFRAMATLTDAQRAVLTPHDGRFVDDEIVQVIKHNGLTARDDYLIFERSGRGGTLKRAAREVVWTVHEQARQYEAERGIGRYCDLPLLALDALAAVPEPPRYRAIVVDEGQDCSPVMVRLARRLLAESNGPLTVFADPAQGIFRCGFQWTQRELRPAGGNVRWLKKTYRTTREVYDLAQPLLDDGDDPRDAAAEQAPPARHGPRPCLVMAENERELHTDLVRRIAQVAAERPANQIGVLAAQWDHLAALEVALRAANVPVAPAARGTLELQQPTVKLLTIQSVKGLDFPVVFLVGPFRSDFGGVQQAAWPETRHTFYVALTRASERVTIGAVLGRHHPLLELLDDECYDAAGTQARRFLNTRGVTVDASGRVVSQS